MSLTRICYILICSAALAGLASCGSADGDAGGNNGGPDLDPPAAPSRVDASQGDFPDLVAVAWEPVATAARYQVLRDGQQIATVEDTGEDTYAYDDVDAEAGGPLAAPEQVTAKYTEQGVEVTWTPGESQPGTTHDYTIVAVNAGGESPPSDPAQGYRASPEAGYFEVQAGESGSWVQASEPDSWIDTDASMPFVSFGEVTATEGTLHAAVKLRAEQPELAFGSQRSYRVRAVSITGERSDASAPATLADQAASIQTEWQRTDIAEAVADYFPLQEDCVDALECTDTAPAANDAVRYYRLKVVAEVDDLIVEDATDGRAGFGFACDAGADPFGGGDGSDAAPWRICSVDQLRRIPEHNGDDFVLASDLDLSSIDSFVPLGNLYGDFDGHGHAIEHLSIGLDQSSSYQGAGLFRSVRDGGSVHDLSLTDVDLGSVANLGAVAGTNAGTITNVEVGGSVVFVDSFTYPDTGYGQELVGGIVATNEATGVIEDSTSATEVTFDIPGPAGTVGGGIAATNDGVIRRCSSTGKVSASTAGGIAGRSFGGRVETSRSTGQVVGTNIVGGLVGRLENSPGVTEDGAVVDSYATGEVSTNGGVAGGLVGRCGASVTRSYSTGAVSTDRGTVGGLVAEAVDECVVDAAYWDEDTAGLSDSAAGSALTTAEFADEANFAGWAFSPDPDFVWTMGADADGNDRPVLGWE